MHQGLPIAAARLGEPYAPGPRRFNGCSLLKTKEGDYFWPPSFLDWQMVTTDRQSPGEVSMTPA
jgi:hypothetical protein